MATIAKKRKPAKRKPSATKKRKAKVAAPATKVTVQGVNGKKAVFSKTSCHTSKTAAKAHAEKIRATGTRAIVRPGTGKTVCVFKGPKMTAAGKKLYATTRRKRA